MFSSILQHYPYHTAVNTLGALLNKRLLLPALIALLLFMDNTRSVTIDALSDAFYQVTVFVAATLLIYYYLVDKLPQLNLSYLSQRSATLEIIMASFMGALPGCGGAIIVVTQFTKGQASFAAVVAVLTATMGDAAFLLMAKAPTTALQIIALGILVGCLSGFVVRLFHTPNFCAPAGDDEHQTHTQAIPKAVVLSRSVWKLFLAPSVVIALAIAFNSDFGSYQNPITWSGAVLGLFAVCIWAISSKGMTYKDITSEDEQRNEPGKLTRVLQDTHFVTAWVVASFLLYELSTALFGLDLGLWFNQFAIYAPLVAIIIGLLPGCGPQIVVTTLYLQGILPFSALAANAVANDGDALFPAIALAPKAALVATLYSAIPAFMVGYGLYFWHG